MYYYPKICQLALVCALWSTMSCHLKYEFQGYMSGLWLVPCCILDQCLLVPCLFINLV
uniref:Uncharacterized protein n=1 Tax=Setaria italica TaxID=4555 RepID=K3Y422_SETIT